jgi:CheY-like chemotaxis protein
MSPVEEEQEDIPGILIVEDDPEIRELADYAARKTGFGLVLLAGDGVAALDALRDLSPSRRIVVLTDLAMPRMNGHELVAALKSDPSTAELPVFMFTSSGSSSDREVALAAGCRAYFDKPTSMDALMAIMAEIHSSVLSHAEGPRE